MIQIYKCRLCGKMFNGINKSRKLADADMFQNIIKEYSHKPSEMFFRSVHYCDNGAIGLADFFGYDCEDAEERKACMYRLME